MQSPIRFPCGVYHVATPSRSRGTSDYYHHHHHHHHHHSIVLFLLVIRFACIMCTIPSRSGRIFRYVWKIYKEDTHTHPHTYTHGIYMCIMCAIPCRSIWTGHIFPDSGRGWSRPSSNYCSTQWTYLQLYILKRSLWFKHKQNGAARSFCSTFPPKFSAPSTCLMP